MDSESIFDPEIGRVNIVREIDPNTNLFHYIYTRPVYNADGSRFGAAKIDVWLPVVCDGQVVRLESRFGENNRPMNRAQRRHKNSIKD